MILGVIPARGGSKGIPGKNIRPLLGKPLIVWSIEAARESRLIDRFVLSTEDAEIASAAREVRAEVLDRPEELATDTATTVSVLQHVLERIDADTVVLLQPTSPIRVDNIIDRAIKRFLDSGCDTLATGYDSHHFGWTTATENVPRQKLDGYFRDDGNVYVFKSEVLKAGRWTGNRLECLEVSSIYNLEIDTLADFWATEGILRHVLDGEEGGLP